jgi:hypothetical protein
MIIERKEQWRFVMKINKIEPNVKRFIEFQATILIIVIFLLLCFSLNPVNGSASTAGNTKAASYDKDRQKDEIRKMMIKSASANFRLSLEMKENVDFVLTPALLVQEVISEDVVITYPSE